MKSVENLEQEKEIRSNLSDDSIHEIMTLAERLRVESGGELNDEAILAVAEATGAPEEYVRLAIRSTEGVNRKRSVFSQLKSSFYTINPITRRYIANALLASAVGVFSFISGSVRGNSGLPQILIAICYIAGVYNAMHAKNAKTATISGAILGAVGQITLALLGFFQGMIMPQFEVGSNAYYFLGLTFLFGFLGALGQVLFSKYRAKIGFGDPAAERHRLLEQLVEIQQELASDEKFVTFLSIDMASSTKIKEENDPLAVEFTFNEYHDFIKSVVEKHGGQIHSTAGDGVTAFFNRVGDAYKAGKAMQAGLFEFNAFRNKLSKDIEMRAAMHTGSVLAPGKDLVNVNFAHVIDVAAHLQKVAPIGSLVVSSEACKYLGGAVQVGEEEVAHGESKGYVWWPKQRKIPILDGIEELNQ